MRPSGFNHSIETKEKIRNTLKDNYQNGFISPMKGKHHTNKVKRLIGYSSKHRKISEETREKMRARMKGEHNFMYNKQHSKKSKIKMSKSRKILRQVKVDGYFIDGYISTLNIAIEIDELKHECPKIKEHDKLRQEEIINNLNCKFIRIKDY